MNGNQRHVGGQRVLLSYIAALNPHNAPLPAERGGWDGFTAGLLIGAVLTLAVLAPMVL